MRTLQWLLCGVVMAIGACAAQPDATSTASTEQDATDQQQAQTIQTIVRSQPLPRLADETCTETWGACKTGQCELGANDVFLVITEVCCTGGTCTTERYRLCGC